MNDADSLVIIVDDDASFRRSTARLLQSAGYTVEAHASAREFLACPRPDKPACLVSDVRMPGLSGLDLQRQLKAAGWAIPIIFITGQGDIPMSVHAMKAGAVEFLTKPFHAQHLFDAVRLSLDRDRHGIAHGLKVADLRRRYASLTPREREVMAGVISGRLNKQIADDLHVTEKTAKFHRGHVMGKMHAMSVADLVRMATALENHPGS